MKVSSAGLALLLLSVLVGAVVWSHLDREALGTRLDAAEQAAERVPVLEARLAELNTRLDAIAAPRPGRPAPDSVALGVHARGLHRRSAVVAAEQREEVGDEVYALREDVDALLTGEALEAGQPNRAVVADVIKEVRGTEREERWQKRAAGRAQAEAEWLSSVADTMGLDEGQTESLVTLLAGQQEQRRTLRRGLRSGELEPAEVEAALRANRQAEDAALGELLTPEQQTQLEQARQERQAVWRNLWR